MLMTLKEVIGRSRYCTMLVDPRPQYNEKGKKERNFGLSAGGGSNKRGPGVQKKRKKKKTKTRKKKKKKERPQRGTSETGRKIELIFSKECF